jgi:uncharacterized protein (TIGR03435 family)
MRARAIIDFALLAGGPLFSQSSATSFEVASVRPYVDSGRGPRGTDGGPGTRDPERYTGRGMSLRLYLCVAFDTADCDEQIAGPSWIDDKYDIVANVPAGATTDQFHVMLQNLLIERFRLVLRHQTKTLPVYD